jgi:hypothetical protein
VSRAQAGAGPTSVRESPRWQRRVGSDSLPERQSRCGTSARQVDRVRVGGIGTMRPWRLARQSESQAVGSHRAAEANSPGHRPAGRARQRPDKRAVGGPGADDDGSPFPDLAASRGVPRAPRVPRPVSELVARELLSWDEFGHRLGGNQMIMTLVEHALRTPAAGPSTWWTKPGCTARTASSRCPESSDPGPFRCGRSAGTPATSLAGLKRQSRHDRVNCGVRESPAGWCHAARWA